MSEIILDGIPFLGNVELKVFIDGELIEVLPVLENPEEGQSLQSNAITAALEGREVTNVSYVGTMVMISTEPAQAEMESENG